jgi:uncharacterized protein involved in type VI secretion and phage assembly
VSLAESLTSSPNRGRLKTGLTLAKVTNINDPDALGRVKCRPISENPDIAETDWCFCMTPSGGTGYGIFFFPNVDDLVILGYLDGEIHHPFVLGRYWANEVTAPYKIESGKNEISSIKTPTAIEIKLDDAKEKQKLLLTTPSGAKFQIDDEAKTITAQDKDGKNSVRLNWEAGEMELLANKKITIAAGDAKIILESSGNIRLDASASITQKSRDVSAKGDSSFKAEAMTAEVKANGQLTLQASGVTEVKGAMVKIN